MALFKDDWEKLAPNTGVAKEAERINRPNFWRSLEGNATHLWGECKSGGARFFRTVVHPQNRLFYCNCSSQQVPCPHALSLLLFTITQPDIFRITHDLPTWLEQGKEKLRPPGLKPKPLVDPALVEARQQRVLDDRVTLMRAGSAELLNWVKDNARLGLAALYRQPDEYWEQFAALMVDAKLGAIGKQIRQVPAILKSDDWSEALIDSLTRWYLFAKSMQVYASLEDHWQEELLVQGGMTTKKKDLEKLPGVVDYWLVLDMEEGQEDRLDYRITYLFGTSSQVLGMLLDYSWNNQGYDHYWRIGQGVQAEAVDYPGAYPIRLHLKNIRAAIQPVEITGFQTFQELLDQYAQVLALNPLLRELPVIVEQVLPIPRGNDQWLLVDQQDRAIALQGKQTGALWKVLAVSGGNPLSLFGTWDGRRFLARTILQGAVIPL